VLVPRLREVAAGQGGLPRDSDTAAWATRQFDGAPEADDVIAVLRDLDALVADRSQALVDAVATGDRAAVEELLARGAKQPAGTSGIRPLHVAAAGGSPALAALCAGQSELAQLGEPRAGEFAAIATALVAAGGKVDARTSPLGLTPLMVATCSGRRDVADALVACGADPSLRDELGRTAERFAVLATIGRAIRLCRTLPMVVSAYLAQVHAPASHQFTSPVLGLELDAPLPGDAFASWPASEPVIVLGLGDDAWSRLVRLAPPIHRRLTRDLLVEGRRYRLLAPLAGFPAGEVVAFVVFHDIDNHFGRYEFVTADGRPLVVAGDFAATRGPLDDLHLLLVEL